MNDRNTSKLLALGFSLVVLLSGFTIALAAGGAVAQSDSGVLVDDSFTPTNSTESAYVDLTGASDMNGSGPVSVDVTFEGLAEGETAGNGTVLAQETVSVSEGNVSSSDFTLSDSDREYDSIRVEATTSGNTSLIASTDWGTLERTSGGGGGMLSGSVGGIPLIGIVVVVGAYFVLGRD
jgi:hypothetical protein